MRKTKISISAYNTEDLYDAAQDIMSLSQKGYIVKEILTGYEDDAIVFAFAKTKFSKKELNKAWTEYKKNSPIFDEDEV